MKLASDSNSSKSSQKATLGPETRRHTRIVGGLLLKHLTLSPSRYSNVILRAIFDHKDPTAATHHTRLPTAPATHSLISNHQTARRQAAGSIRR